MYVYQFVNKNVSILLAVLPAVCGAQTRGTASACVLLGTNNIISDIIEILYQ